MQTEVPAKDKWRNGREGVFLASGAWAMTVIWSMLWFVHTRRLWSQTGYLHLAFAQSLEQGKGFGVQGRAVYGDASPLWVALLAGTHRGLGVFTPDWMTTGKVLTVIAAIFFAAGLRCFARQLLAGGDAGTRRLATATLVLVAVASPYWGTEAFSGTEVLAAAGVACWGCAFVTGRLTAPIRPARLLAACVCAGCGPLLRPEMLFFSLCLAPFLFVRWVNTPLRPRVRVPVFFSGLLFAVGPGACWLLYTVRQFGTALPNTLGAEGAAPGESVVWQSLVGIGIGAPWLLGALMGGGVWLARRYLSRRRASAIRAKAPLAVGSAPAAWLPVAWAALAFAFYLATHTAVTSREVILLAPACTASLFAAGSQRWRGFARRAGPLCAGYGAVVGLLFAWPAASVEGAREQVYADLARTLRGLPGNERVALAPVGEVLFLSAHPCVDLGGVLDPSALAFRWEVTDARRVWWVYEQGARAMLLDHSPEPGSRALWSRDLPTPSWRAGSQTFDRITLWHLPPSPTVPAPTTLPNHADYAE